jgi:hypothetical protein
MSNNLRKIIREEVRKMLAEAKAQVNTSQYVGAHGKEPKGTGNWAFQLRKSRNDTDGEIIWPSGQGRGVLRYADALKIAQKTAQEEGIPFIFVLP